MAKLGVITVAERNAVIPRTCRKCGTEVVTDAKGIKEHDRACGAKGA